MSEFERLLAVQDLDTALDQLAHRRATLPLRDEIVAADAELARLDAAAEPLAESRHALERDQKRLEDEVRLVRDRSDRENARLYDGSVTAIKELQAIQDELEGLGRRQAHLEDQVLEIMEADEPLKEQAAEIDAARAQVMARRRDLETALAASEAEIDAEIADVAERRAAAVAEVPTELFEHYEKLRNQLGGVGVAKLSGATCGGCHLSLPAVEIDKIRHSDPGELVHCFECGRILVH